MLTAATVGAYLEEKGLLAPGAPVEVTELGGGVSNIVLGVEADGLSCVVKQSLPRLRVADEWLAKRERAVALDRLAGWRSERRGRSQGHAPQYPLRNPGITRLLS